MTIASGGIPLPEFFREGDNDARHPLQCQLILIADIYHKLSRRRRLLAFSVLLFLVLGWVGFLRQPLSGDVAALLPDHDLNARADFRLLAQAPLARRIVLRLRAEDGQLGPERLFALADALRARLKPPLFSSVSNGSGSLDAAALQDFALGQWANLLNTEDLAEITGRLESAALDQALAAVRRELLSPAAFLQKEVLLTDPLNFRALMYKKLAGLNPAARGWLVDGHFLSGDGGETLLFIETPVAITDFAGAEKLYAELDRVLAETLPPSVGATALSGHLYTIANARAIQRDLKVVLTASLLALVLIFLLFLRRLRALLVFLLPLALLGPALALAGGLSPPLSAITVGFGAVLLGIAIDYGLHLYFALQAASGNPARTVAGLAAPLAAAALTSVAALSVQLFSALPGQRQLALFAGSGLLLALLLALLVLPHYLSSPANPLSRPQAVPGPGFSRLGSDKVVNRRLAVALWGLGLLLCALFAGRVGCVGDLREVNLVPAELKQAEKELAEVWGEVRGRALVFSRGGELETALAANDEAYRRLCRVLSPAEVMSLAPVLPALATQAENQAAWTALWRQRLPVLRNNLTAAARRAGFSETAFAPFFAALAAQPPPLTPAFWRRSGCGPLLDVLLTGAGSPAGGFSLLSLIPDRPGLAALFPVSPVSDEVLSGELNRSDPGAALRLVSPAAFSDRLSLAIAGELKRFIGLALVVVSLILLLLLRHPYQALLALLPVLAGLLTMFGIMGALGLSFNIFNLVAAILLIGLGVDYGIFMVFRLYRGHDAATEKAVLVSALTTLAGFGVLILARHPALNSIGLTVFLGVIGALPTVLFILPRLKRS